MGLKISGDICVFRNEKGFYSTGISNKLMDGNYDNAYITIQFKKGIELENKTKINITNGFLTFYRNQNDNNKPIFKIMVLEFTTDGDAKEETNTTTFSGEDLPF